MKAVRNINLSTMQKLAELTKAQQEVARSHKGSTVFVSVTGTFPIAKQRNVEGKKTVVEGGVKLAGQILDEYGSKWLSYVNMERRRCYVKIEDAKDVVFTIHALSPEDEAKLREAAAEAAAV